MKVLSLLLWVTQFGFSVLFPLCLFLWLGTWLQAKYALGIWVVALFGILGFMTSVSTAKACLKSILKAADDASDRKEVPIAFNEHK